MATISTILRTGSSKTLFAAFLYFDFCFAVWVLNGAIAPFITEHFKLSPSQTGLMISVPIMAGALMRLPLGVLAQYIGRKNAAITEMVLIIVAMIYGYFIVTSYSEVLAMGVLLGIAGASFGVALSLGSGWFPPQYKGFAMGLAGAGNSGTVLAVLFAPPIAAAYGWNTVYGVAGLTMFVPLLVMIFLASEPPDRNHDASIIDQVRCLWERDGWAFNLIYVITFGGFIGLSNFLPTFFYEQFGVTKVQAGQLTMLAALMGSGIRIVGGYAADRLGGILVLSTIMLIAIAGFLITSTGPNLFLTTVLFMVCFAALGAGNGALFQLVPLRWPATTAVAGSMIGEVGALGGSIVPLAMGLSKQYTGSFSAGFLFFAGFASLVLLLLRHIQRSWVGSWIGPNGRFLEKRKQLGQSGCNDATTQLLR
jgi:NNP family nitrate/nitrite transporter-like MFS transporter